MPKIILAGFQVLRSSACGCIWILHVWACMCKIRRNKALVIKCHLERSINDLKTKSFLYSFFYSSIWKRQKIKPKEANGDYDFMYVVQCFPARGPRGSSRFEDFSKFFDISQFHNLVCMVNTYIGMHTYLPYSWRLIWSGNHACIKQVHFIMQLSLHLIISRCS